MATFRAIAAASEGIIRLLRSRYRAEIFDGHEVAFTVCGPGDFLVHDGGAGVTLYVYRVVAEGTHRTPPGRFGRDGKRKRSDLPLELHFLLTAWATDASLQLTMTGWMMRILEDTPSLPSTLLNAAWPDVFRPDEGLEVVLADLSTEDLFHLWNSITDQAYQISIPYVARVLRIESMQDEPSAEPVIERNFLLGDLRSSDELGGKESAL